MAKRNLTKGMEVSFEYDPKKVATVRCLGGIYNGESRTWFIPDEGLARRAEGLMDGDWERLYRWMESRISESSTSIDTPAKYEIPDGLRLLHPQYSAVRWVVKNEAVLEADPMGAGKTVICAVSANHVKAKKVLVVCPASVKSNWRREWRKWNMAARNGETTVGIAVGDFWPPTDVVICNYDILHRFKSRYDKNGKLEKLGQADTIEWDLVVLDESTYIKSPKSRRTRAVLGEYKRGVMVQPPLRSKRRIAMSGTPILNRPIEIWTTLAWLYPASFEDYHVFGMKYAGAHRGKYGMVYGGSKNEKELNARMRVLGMIGRPKTITHAEVPKKSRQIIELEVSSRAAIDREKEAYLSSGMQSSDISKARVSATMEDEESWREAMRSVKQAVGTARSGLVRARVDAAMARMPQVEAHIKSQLEEYGKAVVFCWHKDVANELLRRFPGSAFITGDVSSDERQANIDKFQNDENCKVFIGTMASCGMGITLTASNLVIFVELDWVPGVVLQAEDRCHRYGQMNNVVIQYLVAEESADAMIAASLIDKIEIIEACTSPAMAAMHNVPVEIELLDMDAISDTPKSVLEEYARTRKIPANTGEALQRIAQGRVRKVLRSDQALAALLHNIFSNNALTDVQKGMVLKLIERYGVEYKRDNLFD